MSLTLAYIASFVCYILVLENKTYLKLCKCVLNLMYTLLNKMCCTVWNWEEFQLLLTATILYVLLLDIFLVLFLGRV